MADTRKLVVQALCKIEQDQAWSNLTLDHMIRQHHLSSRDSAFSSALFYGVLERMLTLDCCISKHSSVKLRKLSLTVKNILRTGVYQLLYMDSIPDAVAVAESVALTRTLRQHKSSGFVNAVLRAFLRAEKQIPIPANASPTERLSILYSCPEPLVCLWIDTYGEETTTAILTCSLGRPPLYLRVNTLRISAEQLAERLAQQGFASQPDTQLAGCLMLESVGSVAALPEYREGLFHVQDKASQLCAQALAPEPGMRVLDVCAAPGGKSFTMAELMENQGELLACDLHPHRTELIAGRALELGLTCIQTQTADMSVFHPELGLFDRILCDVPCSGLGVIRRKPEIKYKPISFLDDFPIIQYKLLETSAQYCKVEGVLMYATCTLNPKENQAIAERFLREHPDFAPHPLPDVPDGAHLHTMLGDPALDGFFRAAFVRKA